MGSDNRKTEDQLIYAQLDRSWRTTCKTLLGEDIGELDTYAGYLQKYVYPVSTHKSIYSGKDTTTSVSFFDKSTRLISHDESDVAPTKLSLLKANINQIKDLDSILETLNPHYAGNAHFGNSKGVIYSDRIGNSQTVYRSSTTYDSRNIAYSCIVTFCEHGFGCPGHGESTFCIKCYETYKDTRCMEVMRTYNSSDCYYTANLENCSDCMFSFNQRGKRQMIGNLQLPKDDYSRIKKNLIEDIRETLKSKKTVVSMPEILGYIGAPDNPSPHVDYGLNPNKKPSKNAQSQVEFSFGKVTQILFGKPLHDIDSYADFLSRRIWKTKEAKSRVSQNPVYYFAYRPYDGLYENMVSLAESFELGKKLISAETISKLRIDNAKELLSDISYFSPESFLGENQNLVECALIYSSRDCYRACAVVNSKSCGYCFWPRHCEHIFGCHFIFSSSFCMNCYNSSNLTRCFEVSDSGNCSDCYFCYNVEALQNCMFCFNAKNLRYAIANVELGKERYEELKKTILETLHRRLETTHSLPFDIYSIRSLSATKEDIRWGLHDV